MEAGVFLAEADFAEEIFTVVVLKANGAGEWVTWLRLGLLRLCLAVLVTL